MEFLTQIGRVPLVIFGIGLVIFVHELGHYLAARMCGVRVVTFSLGFGPRLIGRQIGATMYQIAAVPLGGFCRMAGEDGRFQERAPLPDELGAKSVEARFFIYSGGVIMNVVFALVMFPVVFHLGVPMMRPDVGPPMAGSPAWEAGLVEGSQILSVDGNEVFDFMHVGVGIALADPEGVELELLEPGASTPRKVLIRPDRDEELGIQIIGISGPLERDADGNLVMEIEQDSPAWRAGLRTGDRLVRFNRATNPAEILYSRQQGSSAEITYLPAGEEIPRTITLVPDKIESSRPIIGVHQVRRSVVGARGEARRMGLLAGDVLLDVDGRPVRGQPDWAAAVADPSSQSLHFLRGDLEETLPLAGLTADQRAALIDDTAIGNGNEPVVRVYAGMSAELAGVRDGDRIEKINGIDVRGWTDIIDLIGKAARTSNAPIRLALVRPGTERPEHLTLEVNARPEPQSYYGLLMRPHRYEFRTDGLADAVVVGTTCSWRFLQDSWLTLQRMVQRQVSTENLGGIITIGKVSYTLSEEGWKKLFYFLCLLSINLAFLNVLPIPVLDGGHLLFLIIEKLKGSPVSDRVWAYSQTVGVVLILSLMVYVTYNDLVRWVLPEGP